MTDPTRGRWVVEATPFGLRVDHPGNPTVLAPWLTGVIQVAQVNAGLRRRAEGVTAPAHTTDGLFDVGPTVAELIRIREAAGVDRTVIAGVLAMGKSRIGDYERGRYRPRIDVVEAWAYVLGHDITVPARQPKEHIVPESDITIKPGA